MFMSVVQGETLAHIGVEFGMDFHQKAMTGSHEGEMVHDALVKMGLTPDVERTHLFSLYSPDSKRSIAISVTPYNTEKQTMEGGLSVSEGGHAQAVVVYLEKKTKITRFTTIAVNAEHKVVTADFSVNDLINLKPHGLVEKSGRVKTAKPLIEITNRQARSIGNLTFHNLLIDKKSQSVHNPEEIEALRANSNVVSEISQFVLMRTQGSACCSCSCSCWGSSSCSCSYGG
jgi:hypothetical protein